MARRASAFADEVGTRTNLTPLFAYDGAPSLPPLPPPHAASAVPPPRARMASEIVLREPFLSGVASDEVTAPLARDRRWESDEHGTEIEVEVCEEQTERMPTVDWIDGRYTRSTGKPF